MVASTLTSALAFSYCQQRRCRCETDELPSRRWRFFSASICEEASRRQTMARRSVRAFGRRSTAGLGGRFFAPRFAKASATAFFLATFGSEFSRHARLGSLLCDDAHSSSSAPSSIWRASSKGLNSRRRRSEAFVRLAEAGCSGSLALSWELCSRRAFLSTKLTLVLDSGSRRSSSAFFSSAAAFRPES